MADDRTLIKETNERFWTRTHYKPGLKLDMSDEMDRQMSKVWLRLYAQVQGHRTHAIESARASYAETLTPYVFVGERSDGQVEHQAFRSRGELDARYAAAMQPGTYRYIALFDLAQNAHAPLLDQFLSGHQVVDRASAAIDVLREQARDAARRSAAKVVGAARHPDGQWYVTTLASNAEAAKWLDHLIEQPTSYVYAAYFDKADAKTWPYPISESISHASTPVAGWREIGPTDKKALGVLAAIGGVVALITLWPKAKERRQRRDLERLLTRHREWKRNQGLSH